MLRFSVRIVLPAQRDNRSRRVTPPPALKLLRVYAKDAKMRESEGSGEKRIRLRCASPRLADAEKRRRGEAEKGETNLIFRRDPNRDLKSFLLPRPEITI